MYTAGLPDDVAAERRAELASDVWEQRHDPSYAGDRAIVARLLRGVPADLVWRVEITYHLGGLMRGTAILVTRVAAALVALVAAVVLLWGLTWTSPGVIAVGIVLAAVAGGLWWSSTTPDARERHRRLAVGGAIAGTCTVVAMALVVSGVR